MRWRVKAVAIAAVTAVVTGAGCAQTVSGTAQRAHPSVPDPERSYGYVDNRCGLLEDSSIQEMLGADNVVRPYSGAVCQYVLERGSGPDVGAGAPPGPDVGPGAPPGPDVGAGAPPATVDVVFSWFETGSLDRERMLAEQRGAQVTGKDVERHQAFLARRDTNGAGCSATAAAGSGVLSWWVQTRGKTDTDPCKDAEKLLAATLSSDL
jgi:Protein of unknown function (DUF3558)